jgi:hypothetical protein
LLSYPAAIPRSTRPLNRLADLQVARRTIPIEIDAAVAQAKMQTD